MIYPWAQNRAKLERAIGELGPDATEEVLKARYIEMAGKVLEEDGTPVETVEPTPEEEIKPKKPKKKWLQR